MSKIIIQAVKGGTIITVDNTKKRPFTLGSGLFFKKDNYTSNTPGAITYTVVDKAGERVFNPEILSNISLISLDGTQKIPSSEEEILSILSEFEGFKKGGASGAGGEVPDLQKVSEKGSITNKTLKVYETAAYTELFPGSIDLYNKSLDRKTTISNGGISVNWLQNGKSLALYPNRIFMSNSFKMTDTTITMNDDLKKAFQVLLEVDVLAEDPLSAYNNNKQ